MIISQISKSKNKISLHNYFKPISVVKLMEKNSMIKEKEKTCIIFLQRSDSQHDSKKYQLSRSCKISKRHTRLRLYKSLSSSVINFFLNFLARRISLSVVPVSLLILFSTLLRMLLPANVDNWRDSSEPMTRALPSKPNRVPSFATGTCNDKA